MRIRWKYLISINGILIAIWVLYIVTEQVWDREDMLHIEARCLQKLAMILRGVGFDHGRPRSSLPATLKAMTDVHAGTEIMILDATSVIRFSSVAGRVGQRWEEKDIKWVIHRHRASTWQFKDHYHGKVAMLDVTVPVLDSTDRTSFAIHVARRLDLVQSILKGHRSRHAAWALMSTALIGLVLSLVTYLWLIRPINSMTRLLSTSRWYGARERPGDELQRLLDTIGQMVGQAEAAVQQKEDLLSQVESFNAKLKREIEAVKEELTRTQAQLVQKERLSAIGELAASLAHELRNPLHIIRGAAEILARRPDNREASQDVLEEVDRINRFVNDLLDYTRPMEPDRDSISVAPVISSAVSAVKRVRGNPDHEFRSCRSAPQGREEPEFRSCRSAPQGREEPEFKVECSEGLEVEMDTAHLHQVLINLVSNAIEATSEQGLVRISATKDARMFYLRVEDTGGGIARADLERIFDPFYTRRAAGTGLGLAIVKRVVEMYGGTIDIQSSQGQGTVAAVGIPVRSTVREGL